ncbi:hypothetical protein BGZ82_006160 [Podila clonocystis]|nr:hypothetical protein BGZ82_006160 [Podila clonocystis]
MNLLKHSKRQSNREAYNRLRRHSIYDRRRIWEQLRDERDHIHRLRPIASEQTRIVASAMTGSMRAITAADRELDVSASSNKSSVASTLSRTVSLAKGLTSSNDPIAVSTQNESTPSDVVYELNENFEELDQLQKEIKIGHPYYQLFQALYDIFHKRPFSVPATPDNLSPLQQTLFSYIAQRLHNFTELSTIQQKDVYVAASSVANLEMADAETTFGARLVDLQRSMFNTTFSLPPNWLLDLLEQLEAEAENADTLQIDPTRARLLVEQKIGALAGIELQGGTPDALKKKVLEIIKIAASLCEPDIVARPKLTEAMTTNVWLAIFDILFKKSIVSVKM